MKALARTVMWWPGINQDVKNTVNQCRKCQIIHRAYQQHPCNHKVGQLNHGLGFIWTMRTISQLHVPCNH